jgi:hypothetical protein
MTVSDVIPAMSASQIYPVGLLITALTAASTEASAKVTTGHGGVSVAVQVNVTVSSCVEVAVTVAVSVAVFSGVAVKVAVFTGVDVRVAVSGRVRVIVAVKVLSPGPAGPLFLEQFIVESITARTQNKIIMAFFMSYLRIFLNIIT